MAQPSARTQAGNLSVKVRFFEVLDYLISKGEFKNHRAFADRYEINQGNFYMLKKEENRCVDPVYLTWLITDFDISARWLLTGQGPMFAAKAKS